MSPRGQKRKGIVVKKTTIELPDALWRAAKHRAIEEGSDLRRILIDALEAYLKQKPSKREG